MPLRHRETATSSPPAEVAPDSAAASPSSSPSASPSPSSAASSTASSPKLLVDEDPRKKWRSAWVRTYTTLLMLGGFIILCALGHIPLLGLVVVVQVAMFKEVKRLSKVLSTQKALPSFRPLHWYWFCTAMIFSYGRVLANLFHTPLPYHSFVCFGLYMTGVVVFVLSLQSGYYKYQFELFAWVHLTLALIVVQSTFIVQNMFTGLIWFILPALLIITNDTAAYIFGFFFGRTPLIALSPKKTWEGFIGACISTLIVGFTLSRFLASFELMICPKEELNFDKPTCTFGYPYLPMPYPVPDGMREVLESWTGSSWSHVMIAPLQWHGLALALFASIIAPFGGFFASGFKRAFNIKDFGESIPGHGGVTDRMDCQILMGLFVYVYLQAFVMTDADVHANFARFKAWPEEEQLAYFNQIQTYLTNQGLITPS